MLSGVYTFLALVIQFLLIGKLAHPKMPLGVSKRCPTDSEGHNPFNLVSHTHKQEMSSLSLHWFLNNCFSKSMLKLIWCTNSTLGKMFSRLSVKRAVPPSEHWSRGNTSGRAALGYSALPSRDPLGPQDWQNTLLPFSFPRVHTLTPCIRFLVGLQQTCIFHNLFLPEGIPRPIIWKEKKCGGSANVRDFSLRDILWFRVEKLI